MRGPAIQAGPRVDWRATACGAPAEKGANLAAPAPSPVRVRTLLLARAPAALAEGHYSTGTHAITYLLTKSL